MFRFNLVSLALVAALAAPLAASAQTAPAPAPPAAAPPGASGVQPHHRHHRRGLAHALRSLNLTDAQKQQIAGIMKSARAARMANAGTPPDPQTRRANMQALRAQIDGVLTDTQRAQLADTLKRERHMHDDGGAPRPPAATPQ